MTELLDQAVRRVRALPADRQDEVARLLMRLADEDEPVYRLSAEEEADLAEAEAEIVRGDLASDDEVETILARFRR